MRLKLLVLIICCITFTKGIAQTANEQRWFLQSQFSYIKVTQVWHNEKVSGQWVSTYPDPSNSFALSLNVIGGYFLIKNRLSLGMGFGIDGYYNPNISTAPLYGDLRFYLTKKENKPYIHLSLGGNLKIGPGFYRGGYLQLGIGYKLKLNEKISSYLEAGLIRSGVSLTGEKWVESDSTSAFRGIAFTFGIIIF
jgi:hypothetical protein